MSDDEIEWESAFSDDSLDEKIGDAAEKLAGDEPEAGESRDAAAPADDQVPEIVEQTAPAASLAGLTADPPTSVPDAAPSATTAPQPPTQAVAPQVTQQMPATVPTSAPPPVREKKGGRFPIKRVLQVLAGLVPLAIAGFFFLNSGGDPKEALCDKASESADGVQEGLGNIVSSNCSDDASNATDAPVDTEATNSTEAPVETEAADSTEAPVETEVTIVETVPPLSFVYPAGINDIAADGALASGCTPGSDAVPDGIWFVLLSSWSSESVTVDFSCAYTGSTADAQGVLRGEIVQQPKVYLTNDNQKLRTVSFASNAALIVPPQIGEELGYEQTYGTEVLDPVLGVLDADLAGTVPLFIFVNNGELTEMVLQNPDSLQIAGPLLPTVSSNCPSAQEPPTPFVEVSGIPANDPDGGLNIRVAPVDGTVLFAAENGTQLAVTGGCELINGLPWWQLQTPDSTGWASSKYLIASGN